MPRSCVWVQGPPDMPVGYEVRVYSMLHDSLGTVLAAKAIRAAHCLTSIQFSPSSEHILLAYGRCASALLVAIPSSIRCLSGRANGQSRPTLCNCCNCRWQDTAPQYLCFVQRSLASREIALHDMWLEHPPPVLDEQILIVIIASPCRPQQMQDTL